MYRRENSNMPRNSRGRARNAFEALIVHPKHISLKRYSTTNVTGYTIASSNTTTMLHFVQYISERVVRRFCNCAIVTYQSSIRACTFPTSTRTSFTVKLNHR